MTVGWGRGWEEVEAPIRRFDEIGRRVMTEAKRQLDCLSEAHL